MHEWAIADSIVRKVVENAKNNNIAIVTKVGVVLGKGQKIGLDEFKTCLDAKSKEHNVGPFHFEIREEDTNAVGLEFIEGD